MKSTHFVLLLIIGLFMSCGQDKKDQTTNDQSPTEIKKAEQFFDQTYEQHLDLHPQKLMEKGLKKYADKWDDFSPEFITKEVNWYKSKLQYLQDSINIALLDPPTALSYTIFKAWAERNLNFLENWEFDYEIHQMHGIHALYPSYLISLHSIDNEEDAKNYIQRVSGILNVLMDIIKNVEYKASKGIKLPSFLCPKVIEASENLLKGYPLNEGEDHVLYADFKEKLAGIELDEQVRENLIKELEEALTLSFKQGYQALIVAMKGQMETANDEAGVWKFPNSENYYQNCLKYHTTTEITPQQVFDLGLSEVKRIHNEMKEIIQKVSYEGDLKQFFKFMHEDTENRFHFPNTDEGKQEYLDSAKRIINTMKGKLDDLFLTKPKADIIVKRVEAYREKSSGAAFYLEPATDGSRPGIYYANLYNTKDLPSYQMESLAYHEGIPGHHMQLSIAQELEGIPEFRKYEFNTAYVEGWALYAELIPKEIGMFKDPYSDFGRLTEELWRACRLVVDAGIHYKKWTREQGIAFYMENTPAGRRECERMVDRHIVWPGQATAYKIGMLKILELRQQAKAALKDKFDVRVFHDIVLKNGSLTLPILEEQVQKYIQENQAS